MKSKFLSYLFFGLAVVAVALFVLGIIPESIMIMVIGLFGFAGFAALRAFIDSSGYKTYIIATLGIIGVVAQALGLITSEQLSLWLTLWGTIAGITLTQAQSKAKNGG